MNKNELMQEVENLKSRIEELEKKLENVGNEGEQKYPDENTIVYIVDSYGEVSYLTWEYWMSGELRQRMKLLFDSGRIFLTKEAAEEFAEVQRIEDELFALADDDKEWNGFNPHYAISYYCVNGKISYPVIYNYKENYPYFESAESAKNAVETVREDRVRKWLTYKRKRPQI